MTAPGVRSGLRVLVVDDDVNTVETTSLLFLMSGYDAQTAFSGSEAIERARAFKPHLILLDIGMPKMNGYAVARELRRSASVLRMPSMGPALKPMAGVPGGTLSSRASPSRARWPALLRSCDRLFLHTIRLFPGLRLKCSCSPALSALDVVPQRQASFVLGTDCRVIFP